MDNETTLSLVLLKIQVIKVRGEDWIQEVEQVIELIRLMVKSVRFIDPLF
jgi:hypothetical protein